MHMIVILLLMLGCAATGYKMQHGWFSGSFVIGILIFVAMIVLAHAEKTAQK